MPSYALLLRRLFCSVVCSSNENKGGQLLKWIADTLPGMQDPEPIATSFSHISSNILISTHCRNGRLDQATRVFDGMPFKTVASWTAIIAGYAKNGHHKEALLLFHRMYPEGGLYPNEITFASALDACSSSENLQQGKLVHANAAGRAVDSDVLVGTSLIKMYGKCRCVNDARRVFDRLEVRDVVCWTAMVTVYAQNGRVGEARRVFDVMPQQNVASWNAMISAYAQSGEVEEAEVLFNQMPERNIISWTSMITVYTKGSQGANALRLLQQMDLLQVKPNGVTFVAALDACAGLADIRHGKVIHARITDSKLDSADTYIGTALINVYGTAGCLWDARRVFNAMPQPSTVSWNAILAAYARNGQGKGALQMFKLMQEQHVKLDRITFISILSACSHAGLHADGRGFFTSMFKDYGIIPRAEHYACLIDLVGRSGHLDEAEDLINAMPFENLAKVYADAWSCLLGACTTFKDVERGVHALEHLSELDSSKKKAGYCTQLHH